MAEYIRGIIFFLIFASFVGIILPEGKYKSYINIVIGFVVMFLVFEPLGSLSGAVDSMSMQLTQASIKNSAEVYESGIVTDAFKKLLREQMTKLVETLDYKLTELDADVDLETGELKSVAMTLTKSADGIYIEPIKITDSDDADAEIKKIVSDFYQLPEEHIYVTIR